MKIQTISFNGAEKQDIDKSLYSDDSLELLNYYHIETAVRGKENRKEIRFDKNQVIEFEFEDGTSWISSPDTMEDIFPEVMTTIKRSVTGENTFELPAEISHESSDRSVVGKVLLKAVKIFAKKKVGKEVKKLAEKLEDKQLEGKIGLYSVDKNLDFQNYIPDNSSLPYLLLIHGTASSTEGSFGKAAGTDFMNFISDRYEGRILAFQHRTLTENPFQNARDLLNSLPVNCVLHLITTSRGGLVGEVLSRFCNNVGIASGFSFTELEILKKGYPKGYYSEIEKIISEIQNILSTKKIVIEKFIRIACPAGGTTLASRRLDYFFNITLNLIGLGTGAATNPLYMAFRSLTAAVIDSKNKPEILPGLEVQNPSSPFIKALNCPVDINDPDGRIVINNSLVVIAGNSKPSLKLSALLIIASKLFFMRKNDLVVDTGAMTLGTRRTGKVQRFFYEDAQINHFKYFENNITNQAVLTALKSEWGTKLPGFSDEPLSVAVASERNINIKPDGGRIFSDKVTGNKPIVVLLPGIMGSNLEYDEDLIWINYFKIVTGGLNSLKISKRVKANSLVSTSYKKLVEVLQDNYDVVTFPFDWRLPLEQTSALLNRKIKELMKYNQPMKLIGHSMGGVLIRDFIVLHKETWNKLNNSNGFKLIFLGAPLNGSYRIPAVLLGMDRLIDKLSMIDLVHTKFELLQIFSEFKGLLGLLPFDREKDFADPETWKKMVEGIDEKEWPLPTEASLEWFGKYRDQMSDALTEEDLKNAVYIAGRDKATHCDFLIDEKNTGKELVFMSTGEGDQSVTWESGIPKLLVNKNAVYYVNVSHGELACHADMFKGIQEILSTGSTSLFSNTRPSVRGDNLLFKSPDFRDFDLSQAGIDLSVLGIGGESEPIMELPPISVSICHGNLFYARYPLLAGHFEDDGILSAEKQINEYLGDTLNHNHSLGIYPGAIGTSEIFLTNHSGFRGAIIIGLGKPENLTSSELTRSVEQGVCKYLLSLKQPDSKPKTVKAIEYKGISSLIIGGGYGGLSVENSIKGIIQGVYNANLKVKKLNLENTVQIGNIEFVELFEDAAVAALYSLGRIEKQETRSLKIILEEKKLHPLLGGKKRIPNQFASGWWNRITVKKIEPCGSEIKASSLSFSASTSRAHEKEKLLMSTPALIEGTINEMSSSNRWTPQSAKAIFELLIPNDFKEQLKRHANINWIVDYYTAEYPWELLQDEIEDSKPLCVASGMIRQLSTQNYNQLIKSTPENSVLIIADPDLKGFASQLPGALKEGQQVMARLSSEGLNVTSSFKGTSDEIIEKMFSNEYRIIHLSGHGIFNKDSSKGSGMVIGNDMFLTTREIRQMSTAPELVFVNCCHIGKISGVAEEFYQNRYKLAANIGTQLIENGVRCVIAAGWAVDDNAALEFASVFYDRLLAGYTFGESVHDARKSVFEKYNSTNTWGAYQCYGDPFYRFKRRQEKEDVKKKSYLIAQEAEIDLQNLLNELEIGKNTTGEYVKMLGDISLAVDTAKIRTPVITEKEAQIYLELKYYDKACEKFSSLLNVEDATFSFSVAEKYFNAKAKKITNDFKVALENVKDLNPEKQKEKSEEIRSDSVELIQKVLSDMENLVQLMPSSERINILASTYKRKAFIIRNNKKEIYEKAAYNYQRAYNFSNNWYSLTNWLALESTLVLAEIHKWDSEINIKGFEPGYYLVSYSKAVQLLDSVKLEIDSKNSRISYWDMLGSINIGLCKYMIQFSDPAKKDDLHEIKQIDIFNEIGELWKKAGSKGKRFAEIEHIEFIIDALSMVDNPKTKDLSARLIYLKQKLLDVMQE